VRLAGSELREHVRRTLPGLAEETLNAVHLQGDHLARLSERGISSAEFGALSSAMEAVAREFVMTSSEAAACRTAGAEQGCVPSVLRGLVERLQRTPVAPPEWAEIEASFGRLLAAQGGAAAATAVLTAALLSPRTLYQTEPELTQDGSGPVFRLDARAALIQARFALTGRSPDESELAAIAKLDAASFPRELARLAASWVQTPEFAARALDFVRHRFGVQHLIEVDRIDPAYTPELRALLAREFETHVADSFLSPAGSFDQLFTRAPASVLPGLEGIYAGDSVGPSGARRKGVLGLPGLLAAHAGPAGSDPVKRGILVRVELLCEAMPPPVPDADFSIVPITEEMQTRERFEALSALPACQSCHLLINPPGYLFEEFDQLGRQRTTEKGRPINARGTIPPFFNQLAYPGVAEWDGIVPLADWLAQSPEARACFATHFASYVLAEGVPNGTENCAMPSVTTRFTASGRVDELTADLVSSDLFLRRSREAM
jgi:hypothetical protein